MKLSWLLTTVALAACGRTALLDPGRQRQAGAGIGLDDGGAPGTRVSPGVYDAGDAACLATCSTTPGPLRLNLSDDEIGAALIGVWRICSGGPSIFTGAPSDTIGAEFAPPQTQNHEGDPIGTLYLLTQGPSGPVRGTGVTYQQTYQVVDGSVMCSSYQRERVYDLRLKYSPCPREWWFQNYTASHGGTLASF